MRRNSACVVLALALLTTLLHAFSANAAPSRKPKVAPAPVGPPPPPQPLLPVDADPDWRQIMMAPAITGHLRAAAVDPTDEKSIYVATQEGTIVHSMDGGVTWSEIALTPFLSKTPTVGFEPPSGDEYKAIDTFAGLHVTDGAYLEKFNPLGRDSASPPEPVFAPPLFTQNYVSAYRNIYSYPSATSSLLEGIAGRENVPYDDIRFIAICPGGANTVFVVTATKLLGSSDGQNFVELFTARESAQFNQIACNPTNPSEVVITSEDGTFRSTDGGYDFVTIGQVFASAVLFSPPLDDGTSLLFLVAGGELWIGRANEPDEMIAVPTGEGFVTGVTITTNSLWVATNQGVRVSRDLGQSWEAIEELEGHAWNKIAISGGVDGPEHVLALRDEDTWISTDGGVNFRPSFRAESRRRIRWPVGLPTEPGHPPAFLILTSGELWTSAVADHGENPKLADVRAMATRRLKDHVPLRDLVDRAIVKANLSQEQLDSIERRWRDRSWLPGVQLNGGVHSINELETTRVSITSPALIRRIEPHTFFDVNISFTWELPELTGSPEIVYRRVNLYELRKKFTYFIEDAYLERRQILEQLAAGGLDEEQALTLQARLEVLDVVLEEFTTDRRKN